MVRSIALVFVFFLAFSTGCGPDFDPTAKVTGTLTFNGKPAPGFSVVFNPTKGRPATGNTDNEGRFSLSTFEGEDGAVLGEHVVTIADTFPQGMPPMGPGAASMSRVPIKYRALSTSPLKVTVKEDEKNDFVFDMQP